MPYDTDTMYETEFDTDNEADDFEYSDEEEEYADEEYESDYEYDEEAESPFDESEEMELAAELLDVADEGELDYFLRGLIKRAGRAIGRGIRHPIGRRLVGLLRGAAKKALPRIGGVVGGRIAGPVGGRIGRRLATSAGRIFGLELEGLSPEDQEFEAARRVVRLAASAAQKAAASPHASAKSAVAAAAKQHAPGLLRPGAGGSGRCRCGKRSGRWVRRGRKIILMF